MKINRIIASITGALGTVRSASHVVASIEANRRPDPVHLRRLGIDPNTFMTLGHG